MPKARSRPKKTASEPQFPQPGAVVQLKAGKLLMHVFKVKAHLVTCHLEIDRAIQLKTFHRDELVAGTQDGFDDMTPEELDEFLTVESLDLLSEKITSLSDAELQNRVERVDQIVARLRGEQARRAPQ